MFRNREKTRKSYYMDKKGRHDHYLDSGEFDMADFKSNGGSNRGAEMSVHISYSPTNGLKPTVTRCHFPNKKEHVRLTTVLSQVKQGSKPESE